MKKINRIKYIIAAVLALFVFAVTGGMGGKAYAAEAVYSNVLDDLTADSNFNFSDYPAKANDYSLSVLQIAESTAGELFIYVYQPSGETAALRATTVRISTETGDKLSPRDYPLTLLSSWGTLYKYKAEGLTVKDEPVRYYDIAAIHRKWHKLFDTPAEGDNTINEVVFEVGQLWRVSSENGETTYQMVQSETIEITDKFVGFLKYSNGFKLYKESCISHFVAFTANRPIDTLYEAELSYISRGYKLTYLFGAVASSEYTDYIRHDNVIVQYSDSAGNAADGWGAQKYTWDRIERAGDFIAKEDLTDEASKALESKQWVLRFAETPLTETWNVTALTSEIGTEISEVTILRLKFETDGDVYNIGVVDNKQTGGSSPSNNQPGIPAWLWIVIAVVAVIVIILLLILAKVFGFLDIIVKIVKGIFTALWWVISLPFRLIAKLFRRSDEDEPEPPKKTSNKNRSKTTTRKKTGKKK